MRALLALVVFAVANLASVAQATDNLNCVLKKTLGGSGSAILTDNGKGSLLGELESISAEVNFYYTTPSPKQYIEEMTMIDRESGATVRFGHNLRCQHDNCPTENVDIRVGQLVLDLGTRGIFQIWCN
jgi:hypothetical protein